MTTRSVEGLPSGLEAARTPSLPGRGRGIARHLAAVLPAAVVLGVLLQLATGHGAGHRELALAAASVVVTQLVPGVLVWRAVRPETGWWVEDLVLGLAVGAALAVPTQVLAVATGASWLRWLVPVALVAVVGLVPQVRRRVRAARTAHLPWLWGLLVAAATLLPVYQVLSVYQQPVRWSGWAVPYVDLPYHLALAGEVANRWPLHYPQLATEPLTYHWFSYAWMAQVSGTSGAPLDVVLLRFMPALLAVAVPLAAAAVAVRMSALAWSGPAAVVSTFLVAELDVWGRPLPGYNLSPLSPTLGFSTLVLLPMLALMVSRWRGVAGPGAFALVVVLAVVAGGAKGSVVPVVLAGLVVASVVTLLLRSPVRRRVWMDTLVVAMLLLVLLRAVFGSGDGGMTVKPFAQLVRHRALDLVGGVEVGALATVGLVAIVYLGIFLGSLAALAVLLPGSRGSRDPAAWFLAGAGAAGAGAIAAFAHPGLSQWYFLMTAQVPLGLLVGWGAALLVARSGRAAVVVPVGAITGVAAVLVVKAAFGPLSSNVSPTDAWLPLLTFLGVVVLVAVLVARFSVDPPRRRWTAAAAGALALLGAGLVPAYDVLTTPLPESRTDPSLPGAIHAKDAAAARWLRDHSHPDDIVITNRHCAGRKESDRCDHRVFQTAAYSERGVLVEGWAYNQTANELGPVLGRTPTRVPFWDEDLLALNDGFIEAPTASGAARLYDLGVRWVVVSDFAPHTDTLEPYARMRVRGRTTTVHELMEPEAGR